MLETKGIKYISTPRPGRKRGGGAALAVRLENFTISKLNISCPRSSEVVWGILRPKVPIGRISTIISCCFYSPPRSRKNAALIDHITETLQSLLKIHNNPGIIISGDKNDMNISSILSIEPSLRQIVLKPTRGQNILDIIVTNLSSYYQEPCIIPPIHPDVSGHGVPSDHQGVMAVPLKSQQTTEARTKLIKFVRPIPESRLPLFEEKMKSQVFHYPPYQSVHTMVDIFQSSISRILSETFPEKRIQISPYDEPWFTEELRTLRRARQWRYQRHGKDDKYLEIKDKFDQAMKIAILKYKDKVENEVREGKRGSSYPFLKRLGARPFSESNHSFHLPNHIEQELSPSQSAEHIANHFSQISQEFAPLDVHKLPQHSFFFTVLIQIRPHN